MITGKLNLAVLTHVEMEVNGKSGKVKGIFIPYDANHIFQSDKGARNLDILAFEMKEKKDYATHIIKQSLPKDIRDNMSEEERKNTPILGNMNFDFQVGETSNNASEGTVFTPTDNFPF